MAASTILHDVVPHDWAHEALAAAVPSPSPSPAAKPSKVSAPAAAQAQSVERPQVHLLADEWFGVSCPTSTHVDKDPQRWGGEELFYVTCKADSIVDPLPNAPQVSAHQERPVVDLVPGEWFGAFCPTTMGVARDATRWGGLEYVYFACDQTVATPTPTATATATRTPTPVPPTATPTLTPTPAPVAGQPCPEYLHDASRPHGAVHASGCYYGHEHHDMPPAWLIAAGVDVRFDGAFNTSSIENVPHAQGGKHESMKLLCHANVVRAGHTFQICVRYHAADNPHDRSARMHSFQLWVLDDSGNLSHEQGWYDSGDPEKFAPGYTGPDPERPSATQSTPMDTHHRPVMGAVTREMVDSGAQPFTTWYTAPGAIYEGPGSTWAAFGLSSEVTTWYHATDIATALRPEQWDRRIRADGTPANGASGVRANVTWPAFAAFTADDFNNNQPYTVSQFGHRNPDCSPGATVTVYGVSYPVKCLTRRVWSTAGQGFDIDTGSNTRSYPDAGVVTPN